VRERQTSVWEMGGELDARLRALGKRGDIVKTMHQALSEAGINRPAGSFALFEPQKPGSRIVGRVAGIGLTDEINDRHYLSSTGSTARSATPTPATSHPNSWPRGA
jgi:type IV secretory pathway VirD2 relaxase